MSDKKVAIIILNYNSWQDTIRCVSHLIKQSWPNYLLIVVDNASTDDSVEKMKIEWESGNVIKCMVEYEIKYAEIGGIADKEEELKKYVPSEKLVLIKSDKNNGYSAGNNVGIRYAVEKHADAVLIVNPDVVIEDNNAVSMMASTLFEVDNVVAVGPKVVDMDGGLQNPLYEPTFWGEFLLPFLGILRDIRWKKKVRQMSISRKPVEVSKIVGCCMLIKMHLLREINMLDENTFLYCEEAILAAQIMERNEKILYDPRATVKHIHRGGSGNLDLFLRSRRYYLENYKNYGRIKMFLIGITQKLIKFKHEFAKHF